MGDIQQANLLVTQLNGKVPQGLSTPVQIQFAQTKLAQGAGSYGGQAVPAPITVSGCANPTVASIIVGNYVYHGENHGCTVYRKDGVPEAATALIYFWDARDGPTFTGWWFGPKVGGDQVWAFHPDTTSKSPPLTGWKVPWNGDVDPTVVLSHVGATNSGNNGAKSTAWASAYSAGSWGSGGSSGYGSGGGYGGGSSAEAKIRQIANEESMQRRQAELKRKRAEEDEKRKEQSAALVVRKVIQRVKNAEPENFSDLRAELEQVQQQHLELMGSQALKVLAEAEKAITQAQERVDELAIKRAKEEQERFEAEMKVKEEANNVEFLRQAATDDVIEGERKVSEAEELGQPVFDGLADLDTESVPDAVKTVEEAISAAQDELDKVSNSLSVKKESLGRSELAIQALRTEFKALFGRLAKSRRQLESLRNKTAAAKKKVNIVTD